MAEAFFALAFLVAVVLGTLGWREWLDRQNERALDVRARIQSAVDRRLHGESLLAVHVTADAPWKPGQVQLAVPAGWEYVLQEVWPEVLTRVPAHYEVVVTPGQGKAA